MVSLNNSGCIMFHLFLLVELIYVLTVNGISLNEIIALDQPTGVCGGAIEGKFDNNGCPDLPSFERYLDDIYCEQPYFVTFIPKTEENLKLDNMCFTYFHLPDNPHTYQIYISKVYCDGSHSISSHIAVDCEMGVLKVTSPFCTYKETLFAYAGCCDTFLIYRCMLFGECDQNYDVPVMGISPVCRPISISCFKRAEDVMEDLGLPDGDYFLLPMRLPNKCVTSLVCENPSPILDFHRILGIDII